MIVMPAIGLSLATFESFTMIATAAVMAELVGEIKQGPAICIFLQYMVHVVALRHQSIRSS